MSNAILHDQSTFFDTVEDWRLKNVIFNFDKSSDKAIYRPCVRKGKLKSATLYVMDAPHGNFESTTHELAHWLDLAQRGKLERLLKFDYGMTFDVTPKLNEKTAIAGFLNELNVFKNQCRLMRVAGYHWDDIHQALDQILIGVPHIDYMSVAIDHFTEKFGKPALSKIMNPHEIIAKARAIKLEAIQADWAKIKEMFA